MWLNFYSINRIFYINWFLDIKITVHPWGKHHLVMGYLFHMFLDWFDRICFGNFWVHIHKRYWAIFLLFCVISLSGFGIKVIPLSFLRIITRGFKQSIFLNNCHHFHFHWGADSRVAHRVIPEENTSFKEKKMQSQKLENSKRHKNDQQICRVAKLNY